jgi:UDP-N-acetylmuramate--alanine ligase
MQKNLTYNYYFLGIGGIGMSALARYFYMQGNQVAGYDLTPSAITDELTAMGIHIHFTPAIESIPEGFLDKEKTIVVRTPAVPANHLELQYFIQQDSSLRKDLKFLAFCLTSKKNSHRRNPW